MKKIYLILLFLLSSLSGFSNGENDSLIWLKQKNGKLYLYRPAEGWGEVTNYLDRWLVAKKGNETALIYRGGFKGTLYLPNNSGSTPTLNGGRDSTGAIWVKRSNGKMYIYLKGYGWKQYATLSEVDSMIAGGGGSVPTLWQVTHTGDSTNIKLDLKKGLTSDSDIVVNSLRIGRGKGNYNTNVVAGLNAFKQNVNGQYSVNIGEGAGEFNLTGQENTNIGEGAGNQNTAGSFSVWTGQGAGYNNQANRNSGHGYEFAFSNITGTRLDGSGYKGLFANTSGSDNYSGGYGGQTKGKSASFNTSGGCEAFHQNDSGNNNTGFGHRVGAGSIGGLEGSIRNNCYFGYHVADDTDTGADHNLYFGYDLDLQNNSGDNQASFGNFIFGTGWTTATTTSVSTGKMGIKYANPLFGFSVNAKVGLNKDSITVASGQEWYLALDTTTTPNQVKRQKVAATLLGVSSKSTTTANSVYQMTSAVPVNFKSSGGSSNFFIDESGVVGIGIASPATLLHVYNNSTNGSLAHFGNTRTNNATYNGISFGYGAGGFKKSMLVQEQLGDGAARGKIHILNNGTADGSDATLSDARITIDYSGNIGFGVTSPTALNHYKAGSTTASTAPEKFTAGPLLSTIEAGTHEYDSSHYMTNSAGNRFALGGKINDLVSPVSNSGTSETDLYTYTCKANTLSRNGEDIIMNVSGLFNDLTSTATLKFYFNGTNIANTGALTISAIGGWVATIRIKRTSSSTAECSVNLSTPGASTAVYTSQLGLSGLNFTTTKIIKVTGTAGGATPTTGDIQAIFGDVQWWGAANN